MKHPLLYIARPQRAHRGWWLCYSATTRKMTEEEVAEVVPFKCLCYR